MRTIQIGEGWFSEASGGLNRYYADLIARLPSRGVSVNGLVAGSSGVAASSGGSVQPFAERHVNLPARLFGVRQQASRLLAEYPDAVPVAHFALYAAPWLDLARKRPLIVHFHGPWGAESFAEGAHAMVAGFKQRIEGTVCRRADRLVVLSHAFADLLVKTHGIERSRVHVIPGGVNTARFHPNLSRLEARLRLGWPTDRPIVFVVRRLVRRMGLEGLIDALAHTARHVPEVTLYIAGRGPLMEELHARCDDAGLSEHIRLLGFVGDDLLPIAYRAADLSVVPSVALEGFGLTVVESLSAGTPVLVSAVGGLPETIADLSPQCVVRDTRAEALGTTLADALRGTLPLPTALDCIEHARAKFDWSAVLPQLTAVYGMTQPDIKARVA